MSGIKRLILAEIVEDGIVSDKEILAQFTPKAMREQNGSN